MDDDRVRREAAYFTRVESRLVACELEVDRFDKWIRKYEPVVDGLRDRDLMAQAVADKVRDQGRALITKTTILVGIGAIIVPPFLTALFVKYGL